MTSYEMWFLGVLQKSFPKKFKKKYLCYSLFLILLKSFRPSDFQLYWRDTPALVRSSRQRCPVKNGVLRNFAKFTGRRLCQNLFFTKFAGGRNKFFHRAPLDDCFCPVFQNQPFVDLLQNRCSWIIHKIQRKTLMLELLF